MNECAQQYVARLRDDRGETITGGELDGTATRSSSTVV